ncbi:MAG: EamA family transporter [Chloroflexi bacterium]|nr:EamA family transporter [Chloroflexota bacterium]
MTDNTPIDPSERPITPAGLFHLLVVYIVWSSTYLAIRIAVREGSGFPPFSMALMRVTVAGSLLLLWGRLTHRRVRLTRREFALLAASGLLLWTGGNGLVTWAEQRSASSLAALIVASISIWVAIIEAILDRRAPSRLFAGSLLLGFSGIGVLTVPSLQSGDPADTLSILALLGATFTWALGSVLQSRKPVELSARVSAGYQMLFGGIGFLILVLITNEPLPTPTTEAWLAWGYLVLIGGALAFTSYVTALRLLPTNIVMTYAYVNPVLAVILGWWILGESITIWTIAGTTLVLLGVASVFRDRYSHAGET